MSLINDALKKAIGLGVVFASLAVVILIGGGILFRTARKQPSRAIPQSP